MKRQFWKVIEGDNRPAGPADWCFYCRQPHGTQHKEDCVIRQRTIVVRTTIDRVVEVPEYYTLEDIRFYLSKGTGCADNGVEEIHSMVKRLDSAGKCSCHLTTTEYVREAPAEDERANAWPQNDPHQDARQ